MPQLIEVEFKGNRRDFFLWPFDEAPTLKTPVIVDVERGEDFGRVCATGDTAKVRKSGTTHGKAAPSKSPAALRAANAVEITRAAELRTDEESVRRQSIDMVRALHLDMKISDVEWQFDRKQLTVYFTAEKRVDFRTLVRQIETTFSTRVHMWHIGVRDEARRLDGIGRCGRQFCSASWLPDLRPVKSSVAKDQRLSTLNPAQISGTCGRLMCCLRYEHEFYVQQRKKFPKEGKIVTTVAGEEKIVSNDIFRETVTLRNPAGDFRVVPLAQFRQELADAAAGPIESDLETSATDDDDEEEGGSPSRRQQPDRGERTPSAPRNAGQQKQRPPRAEKAPRAERPERPERAERPERPARPPRGERPVRDAAPPRREPLPMAPTVVPPVDNTDDDAADELTLESNTENPGGTAETGDAAEQQRRRRRRRGRRGGRRGGQGGPNGSSTDGPGGAPDAPPSPSAG
ncbi:MAG: regulatory iron-sulfur-containing complex subunit RicT [bacterium]